jgi:hypothetical protein
MNAGAVGCVFLVIVALVGVAAERFLSSPVALFVGLVLGTIFGITAERRYASSPKPYNPDDHSPETREAIEAWIEHEHRNGNL